MWLRLWFLPAIAVVSVIAWALPAPIPGGDWWRDAATVAVFVVQGLALPQATLRSAVLAWRPALRIHLLGFVLAPILALGLAAGLRALGVDEGVARGLIVTAVLPTTITSCVAYTALAGGATAISLVNVVASSIAGVLLAPVLAAWLAGGHGALDPLGAMQHLAVVVLVPFAIGQLLRAQPLGAGAAAWCERHGGQAAQACLLVILLVVLGEALHRGQPPPGSALALGAVAALVLHAALAAAAWWSAASLPRGERLAVLFTASHKSASLGVPLVAVLYAGDPAKSAILAPVLAYHLLQLLLDAPLAVRLGGGRSAAPAAGGS